MGRWGVVRTRQANESASPVTDGSEAGVPGLSWGARLRALGMLLDREERPLSDLCVLDVEGGFVVQAVGDGDAANGELASREITNAELEEVLAQAALPRRR